MFTFSLFFTGYIVANIGPILPGVTLKEGCAHACGNHPNCSSFFYDINTHECYLEKFVYVASHQLQGRSGVQYYSLRNSACPATYIYSRFTNQCLRGHTSSSMRFPDAKILCLQNSGHLAFIRSEEDNKQASIVANDRTVWIGLERANIDVAWRWTNGQPLWSYSNWNPTMENATGQIYGKMFVLGIWGAYGVNGKLNALCEIDVEVNDDAPWCK
ncbi:lectin BRA-3-like [Haliotis cracherodii]|uniref:lectin BRA-3-like n=1 Tax=Haliotis cracherodii TaxID=6455 RepID=UPI0039EAD830